MFSFQIYRSGNISLLPITDEPIEIDRKDWTHVLVLPHNGIKDAVVVTIEGIKNQSMPKCMIRDNLA